MQSKDYKFKARFGVPQEQLIEVFGCTMGRTPILGNLFLSQNHLCFYSNILSKKTKVRTFFRNKLHSKKKNHHCAGDVWTGRTDRHSQVQPERHQGLDYLVAMGFLHHHFLLCDRCSAREKDNVCIASRALPIATRCSRESCCTGPCGVRDRTVVMMPRRLQWSTWIRSASCCCRCLWQSVCRKTISVPLSVHLFLCVCFFFWLVWAGHVSAYCTAVCGDKTYRTAIVPFSSDPKWHERFDMYVATNNNNNDKSNIHKHNRLITRREDIESSVWLRVYDTGIGAGDVLIGGFDMPLAPCLQDVHFDVSEKGGRVNHGKWLHLDTSSSSKVRWVDLLWSVIWNCAEWYVVERLCHRCFVMWLYVCMFVLDLT